MASVEEHEPVRSSDGNEIDVIFQPANSDVDDIMDEDVTILTQEITYNKTTEKLTMAAKNYLILNICGHCSDTINQLKKLFSFEYTQFNGVSYSYKTAHIFLS
jgi:hypothetical protein